MAVPSNRSIDYDALLSLSLEYTRSTLVDNIFTSTPFLAALYGAFGKKAKNKKGVRLQNGGERIRQPLMYGKNTTVGSYSGYDILDVTPQDGITTAFFTWRQLAGSVAISRKEERQNAGEGKIKDLLQAKIMQLEYTLRDELNYQLLGKTVASEVWSAGDGIAGQSSGADLDPLPHLIAKDAAGSVTVGNINQSTYSWWRPQVLDGTGGGHESAPYKAITVSTWATLKQAARNLYNTCSKGGGGFPDFGLLDQSTFESYEAALDDKSRYVNMSKGPASMGFDAIRFKNQDLTWDEMVPDMDGGYVYDSGSFGTGTWFMLNLDFLELVVDSATDFITTPFVRPENQDAKVAQILMMGNLTSSNLRKQGMIYGIDLDLTS